MAITTERLKRLRLWFVVYYMFEVLVTVFVSTTILDSMRYLPGQYTTGLQYVPPGAAVVPAILISLVFFVVALLLFHLLFQRKNWVRILMLVIAWLTAVSGGISLLISFAMFSTSGWLSRIAPGMDWAPIAWVSIVTNIVSLVFSIYMIRVLQFDREIRAGFLPAPSVSLGPA